MKRLEKRAFYRTPAQRQEARRQMAASVFLLLLIIGLSVVCALAYFHAKGGALV